MELPLNRRIISILAILSIVLTCLPSCFSGRASHNPNLSAEQTGSVKEKTCILALPATEYDFIEDYKALVPTAWTLTPIEVIKYEALPGYESHPDKYTFIQIAGEVTTVTSSSGHSYTNTHYYLELTQVRAGKKNLSLKI